MKYSYCSLIVIVILASFFSCSINAKQVNTTTNGNDSLSVNIQRLDIDLYDYLQNPNTQKEIELKKKYGDLLEAFGAVTINNSDVDSTSFFETLKTYFQNPTLNAIYTEELSKFKDLTPYTEELSSANQHIYKLLDNKKLPPLAIHVSGFKENIIIIKDYISVSGDKYLGTDFPIYENFFENYQRYPMQSKMITHDILKAWLMSEYKASNERKNLLAEMIYQGKILYALEQLLPEWSEADILVYTAEQQKWSNDHAKEIWNKTINNNYLFSNDYLVIQKYMNEAPYTATISSESPGRLGEWLGLQIIKNYAENTGADLKSIFIETNNQQILKDAKYNP